ncbi:AAA family ATPase [Bartonella sp. HY038]|uniref:AAA family ATPase n=1 Tax=Bartonella sp. HY038 TaxID=2759660 RepID=UPI0015FC3E7C|nr:AAA family ATPase [Bartonella sp. HY038]
MRIKQLHLTRYGKFTDFTLDFGEKQAGICDFHIIYGLNEAGKSTTFTAWLDFLFGMGKENSYNFLHDYPLMKIGAKLETSDQILDLQRIKANKNSLLDGSANPFGEIALLSNMAGLNRDSYQAMFSLDDDSLEKGGNDILNSKGDLGEILFSATAGLDGVSQKLAEIEKAADAIYRSRASSTAIQQKKKRLIELKQESAEIDVAASAYKRLVKEKREAEEDYNQKSQTLLSKTNEIDRLNQQIELRKKLKNYTEIIESLEHFAGFPVPPNDLLNLWRSEMAQLWQNDSAFKQRKDYLTTQIASLKEKLQQSNFEPKLIKLGDTIKLLADEPKSRFITAKNDIAKRQDELMQKKAELSALIKQLNQPERLTDELLIDKLRLAPLKDLLHKKPLIDSRIASTQGELQLAEKTLQELETGFNTPSLAFDEDRVLLLEAKLTELTDKGLLVESQNLASNLTRLQNEQQQAFAALAPFSGTINDLNGLIIADKDYWNEQYHQLQRLNQQLDDFALEKRQIADKLANIETRIKTLKKQSNLVDSETLKTLAQQKLLAWQNHYKKLDHESANQFSLAMGHYDDALQGRLTHFERIAQLEQAQIDWNEEQKKQTNLEDSMQHKEQERVKIDEFVTETLRKIGIEQVMPSLAAMKFLQDWLIKRQNYQTISNEIITMQARFDAVQADIEKIHADICQNVPNANDTMDIKALMVLGKKFIESQTEQKHKKSESERAFKKANHDISERRKLSEQALQKATQWQNEWNEALNGLWLAEISPIETIEHYINKLELLPDLKQQCDNLQHRITAMEKDMASFHNEVLSLYRIAKPDFDESDFNDPLIAFSDLQTNVIDAIQKADQNQKNYNELQEVEKQYQTIIHDLAAHHQIIKQRFDHFANSDFAVDDLNDLAQKLELAKDISDKRQELAKCVHEIKSDYNCNDIHAALENIDLDGGPSDIIALGELKLAMQPLSAEKEQAFALFDEKRKQLDAIGGDDKVARIESERQTIRLEIEELAFQYLKLKTGERLAQEALVHYRDRHRSSMLKRASQAFHEITSGHYSGLTTQLKGSQETLIAIAKDGKSKLSSDLSKGTRFQLYLALRFAGYQEFAQNHEPIPFIADDIMETFDEPRASEALRLMGLMAKSGQVIYLTHHRHICDLALAAVDNVTIHSLT